MLKWWVLRGLAQCPNGHKFEMRVANNAKYRYRCPNCGSPYFMFCKQFRKDDMPTAESGSGQTPANSAMPQALRDIPPFGDLWKRHELDYGVASPDKLIVDTCRFHARRIYDMVRQIVATSA